MSYLVEALRKAEHERRQATAPDAVALAPRIPPRRRIGFGLVGWVVVLLAICNLLLSGYVLWPQAWWPRATITVHATTEVPTDIDEPDMTRPLAASTSSVTVPAQAPAWTIPPSGMTVARTNAQHRQMAADVVGTSLVPQSGQVAGVDVPDIEINGHLFSNDPAASFILVDGHIYHEGDRLLNGAAVVRIGKDGALFSYRGQYFHANAPG